MLFHIDVTIFWTFFVPSFLVGMGAWMYVLFNNTVMSRASHAIVPKDERQDEAIKACANASDKLWHQALAAWLFIMGLFGIAMLTKQGQQMDATYLPFAIAAAVGLFKWARQHSRLHPRFERAIGMPLRRAFRKSGDYEAIG